MQEKLLIMNEEFVNIYEEMHSMKKFLNQVELLFDNARAEMSAEDYNIDLSEKLK